MNYHGGVELQADVAGAGVEDSTEDALEDHADAEGVEDAVLLRETNLTQVIGVRSVLLGQEVSLQSDQDDEDEAVYDVAAVTDDVVEVVKDAPRSGTAIVEVAHLHVPGVLGSLLLCQHHLE